MQVKSFATTAVSTWCELILSPYNTQNKRWILIYSQLENIHICTTVCLTQKVNLFIIRTRPLVILTNLFEHWPQLVVSCSFTNQNKIIFEKPVDVIETKLEFANL